MNNSHIILMKSIIESVNIVVMRWGAYSDNGLSKYQSNVHRHETEISNHLELYQKRELLPFHTIQKQQQINRKFHSYHNCAHPGHADSLPTYLRKQLRIEKKNRKKNKKNSLNSTCNQSRLLLNLTQKGYFISPPRRKHAPSSYIYFRHSKWYHCRIYRTSIHHFDPNNRLKPSFWNERT